MSHKLRDRRRVRLLALLTIAILTAVGLSIRFWISSGIQELDNFVGEMCYAMFWMMLALLVWPTREAAGWILLGVLAGCFVIEISQQWHPPILESIRSTTIGRILIGHKYDPADFWGYACGCAIGIFWMGTIFSRSSARESC